jgi:hypothetical protein
MWLIYRLACLVGWPNWWDTGEGDLVCLDCGWGVEGQWIFPCTLSRAT